MDGFIQPAPLPQCPPPLAASLPNFYALALPCPCPPPPPPAGTAVSYLTAATPGGEERFDYFKQVVDVPDPSKTALALDFSGLRNGQVWVALITFLYLDFLDATGTLFTMARLINENVPGES